MSNLKTSRQVEGLERLLVYILGVAPWEFGLMADENGWFALKDVIAAIRAEDGFRGVTEGRILEIHRRPGDGSPLEMSEAGIKLKAGRAELADKGEEPARLPKILHLPMKPASWPHVSINGLAAKPGRGGLMLFESKEAALKIAKRIYPDPVLVTVNVHQAETGGAKPGWYAPGIWLVPELKAEWLSGPPTPPKTEAETAKPARKPDAEPAAIWAEPSGSPYKGKKRGKYDAAPEWKPRPSLDRRKERYGYSNHADK